MTEQEYKEKVRELEQSHKAAINKLVSQYVEENKRFSIGDIISQDETTILVEKVLMYRFYSTDTPSPMYHGRQLTAKLDFRKDGKTLSIIEYPKTVLVKKAADHNLK